MKSLRSCARGSAAILLLLCAVGCRTPADQRHQQIAERLQSHVAVDPGDGIDQDEAVSLALSNNPAFQEILVDLGFSHADLIQSGLLTNPSFSILFPWGPKQLEFTATFPLEALWLRPRRVAIARLQADRVAETLVQQGLNLIRDVRVGYSDLLLARERARLADEALKVRRRIQDLSEARLRNGDLSELEAATTRVDALRAHEEAQRARYDVRMADERLRLLTGAARGEFKPKEEKLAVEAARDELEHRALAARPDLRAAELGIEAAGKRAGLAKAEIFAISGVLDANRTDRGIELGPGVQLPIPIFNHNQAGIARAKAEMERAKWNYLSVKDRIVLDVRDAHTRLAQAQEALAEWEQKILPPLEATTQQAQRAFELGNVSLLLVYENTRQLLSARARHAEIEADLRRAHAELERSVGQRLLN
jgi:outer membrane protein, heavy metal efflux system